MSELLPLGIDLGANRVRVASLARHGAAIRLIAVGSADIVGSLEDALAAALDEVNSRQTNAVAMIRTCDARLRAARFPVLSGRESRRAAYFEGVASFNNESEPIAVRSMTLRDDCGEERMLIAATPVAAVQRSAAILKSAGLKAVRIDHEGCALARTGQGPLLDIGLYRSTLVATSGGVPVTRTMTLGGNYFTTALADELGIDVPTAEVRKRTIGLGGAASAALDGFCAAVASEIAALRENDAVKVTRLRLCGNGARLADLIPALKRHLSAEVSAVTLHDLLATDLPEHAAAFLALDAFTAVAAALPSRPFVSAAA
jgi:Tfp pilus assembly PilM family ATPase